MLVPRAACSPSLFTERGLGGEVQEAQENADASLQLEAKPCTRISFPSPPAPLAWERGAERMHGTSRSPSPTAWERGQGGEGWKMLPCALPLNLYQLRFQVVQIVGGTPTLRTRFA